MGGLSLAIQYHRSNNLSLAEEIYHSFLERNPEHPLALSLLGTVYIQKKFPKKAIPLFNKSIELDPSQPFSFCNLGIAEYELKRYESSCNNLSKAILLKADYFEAFNALGKTHIKLGFNEKAFENFTMALNINPRFCEAYLNRADLFNSLENFNKALDDYKNAINIDPSEPFLIQKYGALLIKIHLYDQAISEFENILEIYPNNKSVLLNLGICLQKKRNFFKASEIYNTLLQLDRNNLEALNNKAYIYQCLGEYDEAINLYKKIIKIDKHFPYALLNTGVIMLNKEEFLDGWKLYEYRTKCEGMLRLLKSSKPEVQSFNTIDKTIFIWAEQGIGDQIIYASLLLDAFKTKNKLFVSVDSRLISLFKRSFSKFDNVTFISVDEKLLESKYDFHLPMGSLGKFFRNSIQDFDTHPLAYLKANQREVDSLKKELKKEGLKVCGISWKSNNKEIGEAKTLSLTQLLPILSIPNTIFIDLQYGDNSEEKEKFLSEYGIEIKSINEIDNYNNLDGLTSLIDACDYIVTISNVTAHIAGALHKETYLLLPYAFGKIWYWGQSRDYSLWYPAVKIYRNTKSHSWDETIDDLSKKIRAE